MYCIVLYCIVLYCIVLYCIEMSMNAYNFLFISTCRLGLKHKNIVSILGATSLGGFQDGAWLVMDYVGQRNLQSLLSDPEVDLNPQTRLRYRPIYQSEITLFQ